MSSAKPRNSRLRQLWVGLLLALTSVCLTTFVLEMAARFLPPPYDPDTGEIFACHNSLGWTGTPNFHGIFGEGIFQQELTFNSLGMHDTEHPLEKLPQSFRILMLGDSFVHAVQVSEVEASHQVLEDYLNSYAQAKHRFEVLSSGVVNWGTNQELIYYREQGRYFQPDLVLLMFYIGNDFLDNLPGNVLTIKGFNCYAPYFALCNNSLNPTSLPYAPGISKLEDNCSPIRRTFINIFGTLYQHSRLYQQIEPLIVANSPRQQFGLAYPSPFSALYLPNDEVELDLAYQITQATIAQLQQEVEANGARFAVVLISPWPVIQLGLLSPAEQQIFLKDNPAFTEAQADRPNQRLAKFLNNQKIPFVDLTKPMIEYSAAKARVPLYFVGEGHWTVEGNRIAGNTLAQWLVVNDFFEAER